MHTRIVNYSRSYSFASVHLRQGHPPLALKASNSLVPTYAIACVCTISTCAWILLLL